MTLDHLGELLVGLQALPLQARPPVLEEATRPAFGVVVPELTEGFLEQVSPVESAVGREQFLERPPAVQRQVLSTREQRVLLTLDVASIPTAESPILGLAHLVERLAQMTHDVELVEENRRLRGTFVRHVAKWLPHVHHRQANAFGLLLAQPVVQHPHALLGAVFAAEPDRALANQIAHHDAVSVSLADRDLVDANRLGAGRTRAGKLRPHILHLQVLDRVPVEMQLLGHAPDRPGCTAPVHVVGKALRVMRVVGEEGKSLALHLSAASAIDAPHLELEIDARVPVGQIAGSTNRAVVPPPVCRAASSACRFFERRTSGMTRALRSPNNPRNVASGRNPGNRYASDKRFRLGEVGIAQSCQLSAPHQ